MNKDDKIMLARIEERLISFDERNEQAHKTLFHQLNKLNESVNKHNEELSVLKEQNRNQKWINRTLATGFIGVLISKLFRFW